MPSLGPYRVIEHVAGERVVVESNPHFVGEPPPIRRVEVRVFPQDALVEAFLAGDVDFTVPNAVTMEQALAVRETHPDRAYVRPSDTFVFLAPDLTHPLLGRREVRRAILGAIDREALAHELYGDAGRVAHVAVPSTNGRLPDGTEIVPFDPELARRVLSEACATGASLELIRTSSPMDVALADSLRRSLEMAGLVIVEREVPSAHALYLSGDHGGLLSHVIRGEPDAPSRRYWNLPLRQRVSRATYGTTRTTTRSMRSWCAKSTRSFRSAAISFRSGFSRKEVGACPSCRSCSRRNVCSRIRSCGAGIMARA